ncbi:MAG: hypothetical protein FWF96_00080, partial [Kiritimatiellaeota bacterium]|nr:hypothetical protein [Kiritimatiellota bacterium]
MVFCFDYSVSLPHGQSQGEALQINSVGQRPTFGVRNLIKAESLESKDARLSALCFYTNHFV